MLKVFFPGGDPLVAPLTLQEVEQNQILGKDHENAVSIRFLSRIFSLTNLEQAGVFLNKKKLANVQNLT